MEKLDRFYDISQAASYLAVSDATVINWIKHGYLKPVGSGKQMAFSVDEVELLKKEIAVGNINRLTKRANKVKASESFIPAEYLSDKNNGEQIEVIVEFILKNKLNISNSLFVLSLSLLSNEQLILKNQYFAGFDIESLKIGNPRLSKELMDWGLPLSFVDKEDLYIELSQLELPAEADILGLIYQSILREGEKVKKGLYYTPGVIVQNIVSDYVSEESRVLDPCCGTGQFLLEAAKVIKDPSLIHGTDIDELAVKIARINLIRWYKDISFEPNIYVADFLADKYYGELLVRFDLIMTNPPWGVHYSRSELKFLNGKYPDIKSKESFSYMLNRSLGFLKDDGKLSFILPESILNVKIHQDIRKILLTETNLLKIENLQRVFKRVFTNVIRLDLQQSNKKFSKNIVKILNNSISYKVRQKQYLDNQDFIININATSKGHLLISKVYASKHHTLKDNAEWALGIVTGNNAKFISGQKADGAEPIVKGKNVGRYKLKALTNQIRFEPTKFQQVAPEYKYRVGEKLIYKFISNRLVFAYDDSQLLTLNSANILIPEISGYSIKIVLALFNSTLYQFLYQKLFSSIKILRSQLEVLPLPDFSDEEKADIVEMVDSILNDKTGLQVIDRWLYDYFGFNEKERAYIKNEVR